MDVEEAMSREKAREPNPGSTARRRASPDVARSLKRVEFVMRQEM